jgi:exodeoxyribonuclease-5
MSLTTEQQKAVDAFGRFLDDPSEVIFALLGWAGCGKSYTASFMYQMMRDQMSPWDEMLWLAPTWKATHVSGEFLRKQGATFETRYDPFKHVPGKMVLTTTQQALGIAPVIDEDQTDDKIKFGKIAKGTMETLRPRFIVIDEVSMLSRKALKMIYRIACETGTKVLVVGDPGQLPPVGEEEIKWSGIKNRHTLQTIMRQANGSMIPTIAEAIRKGENWRHLKGAGIDRVLKPAHAFLDNVTVPALDESERDVFLAYRNSVVNQVQEAACQKVYGHGRDRVEPGQIVLAQSSMTQWVRDDYGMLSEERICNQDELKVLELHGNGQWGRIAEVERSDGTVFHVEYVTQEALANPNHPYRVELKHRGDKARELQKRYKTDKSVDFERREAWKSFFQLKDNTVLSFAHPFAMTSHKSQGSSYRRAFVDANDIERFSSRGLYVAATRPKETLVI